MEQDKTWKETYNGRRTDLGLVTGESTVESSRDVLCYLGARWETNNHGHSTVTAVIQSRAVPWNGKTGR